MKTFQYEKTMIATAMLTISGFAAAYGCPPVIDSIWQVAVVQSGVSLNAGVGRLAESVSVARNNNLKLLLSAMKVLTKQIDVSTSREDAVAIAAKQGGAVYAGRLQANAQVFNAVLQYSAETGQGFDPCGELRRSKDVAVALGEANHSMGDKVMREIDASPGRIVSSTSRVLAARIADGKKLYCTADEQKMGFCTSMGTLPGGDVDPSNFFASAAKGDVKSDAKSALLNHIFGLPYQAPPKNVIKSPASTAFFDAKRSEDAVGSVAQNSLKTIQSWTEESGSGDGKSDSVLSALGKKVDTYSGGTNYGNWEKSKMSQSEHGLLVEYAKMAATELFMMQMEYQQAERTEANVATLLALRVRSGIGAGGFADSAAQRVAAENLVK